MVSIFPDGLLAFFANGANPQQEINVAATAMHPLILPIKKYSLFADPSEPNTNPAIIKPVSPAIIDPVNLEAFSLVLIDVFSEISVDRAAKGRLILVYAVITTIEIMA